MSTVESTLELLRERFPKCFARYPQPRQPLKIGVHKDLAVVLAGVVSKSEIGRALTAYTNDVAYREALKPGAVRIDLNGEPAGVVTPGQIPPPRSKPPGESWPLLSDVMRRRVSSMTYRTLECLAPKMYAQGHFMHFASWS